MLLTWQGAGWRWGGTSLMIEVLIFFQLAVAPGWPRVSMVLLQRHRAASDQSLIVSLCFLPG